MAAADANSGKISAFVVACDRDPLILEAVLLSARFADEVVLINKGKLAANSVMLADACYTADWSPTVEPTRAFAVDKCTNDWIVCLDDDEVLSSACAETFRDFVRVNRADVLGVPIKHHILGRFDDRAYYWPEWRPALFRRGAVEYGDTVHGGTRVVGPFMRLMEGQGAFITHLSHPDIATWLEKTNRYTSVHDRSGVEMPPPNQLAQWAVEKLLTYVQTAGINDYRDAVALLRGLYDIVDGLKRWEEAQPDGHQAFEKIARSLCAS